MWTLAMCPGAGRLRKTLAALRAQLTRSSSPVSARTHTHSVRFCYPLFNAIAKTQNVKTRGACLPTSSNYDSCRSQLVLRVKAAMQLGGNIGDTRMMDDGTKDNKKRGAIQGPVIARHILSWRPIKKEHLALQLILGHTHSHTQPSISRSPVQRQRQEKGCLLGCLAQDTTSDSCGSQLVMRVKQFGHL